MRRLLLYIILLGGCFVLLSLLFPSNIESKQEILLYGSEEQVYQQLTNVDSLLQWLPLVDKGAKANKLNHSEIKWGTKEESSYLKVLSTEPHKIMYEVWEGGRQKLVLVFKILPLLENKVSVYSKFQTPSSVNPLNKFYNLFGKTNIKNDQRTLLNTLKERVEAYKYEKFRLRNIKLKHSTMLYLVMKQKATLENLDDTSIPPNIVAKIKKYRLNDSTKKQFIQYTNWSDSLIDFNICLPVIQKPTAHQLWQLRPLQMKEDSHSYLSAIFTGKNTDIGEAWDSLHNIAKARGYEVSGYPLEQILEMKNNLVSKRLYVRVK